LLAQGFDHAALQKKYKSEFGKRKTALNSSLSNRGAALVFLFTLLAGTSWIAGCAGGVSASAPSPEPPPAQPVAAMLTVTPNSISVSTSVGNTSTETVTATNMGDATVAINQATVTAAGLQHGWPYGSR
jgi:hypothetical protein